jgi:hypothetical protein
MATGESVNLTMMLTLTVSPELVEEYSREIKRIEASLR